jgi:hypothetical protein
MLKHKGDEFKMSTVEYYLTEDVSPEQSCRIYECNQINLLRCVEKCREKANIKLDNHQPIAYKINPCEVNFVIDEIKKDTSITMDSLLQIIQYNLPDFDVTKRYISRESISNTHVFKTSTFSNYKITDVKNRLIHSLQVSDVDTACYWVVELICSNNFQKLWEIIFYFYATYIHISNPKVINYLDSRYKTFKQIYESVEDPIVLKDNSQMRKLFGEIITLLCLSNKMYVINYVGIPNDDFNMALIYIKYKAPTQDYITPFYKENDPKHMITFFNEFIYNIEVRNCFRTYYWLEYILGYEKILHKYKEKSLAGVRDFILVSTTHSRDIIWIVWEILLTYSEQKGPFYFKLANSAFYLFSSRYSSTVKQSKKYFIYLVISFLLNEIDPNIPIIDANFDMDRIHQHTTNIYNELNKIHQNNLLP